MNIDDYINVDKINKQEYDKLLKSNNKSVSVGGLKRLFKPKQVKANMDSVKLEIHEIDQKLKQVKQESKRAIDKKFEKEKIKDLKGILDILNIQEFNFVLEQCERGEIKILYAAPEKLLAGNSDFVKRLKLSLKKIRMDFGHLLRMKRALLVVVILFKSVNKMFWIASIQ